MNILYLGGSRDGRIETYDELTDGEYLMFPESEYRVTRWPDGVWVAVHEGEDSWELTI